MCRENSVSLQSDKNNGYFTFFIISGTFLLRIRNVSEKSCRENQNTYFMFNNFFSENCAVYVTTWKNIVQPGRQQTAIWRTRIACWITKATHTDSDYVILIPFPTATMVARTRLKVSHTYIACLAVVLIKSIAHTDTAFHSTSTDKDCL